MNLLMVRLYPAEDGVLHLSPTCAMEERDLSDYRPLPHVLWPASVLESDPGVRRLLCELCRGDQPVARPHVVQGGLTDPPTDWYQMPRRAASA